MAIERNNGNMAGSGAVARMFKRQAHFIISGEWADEEKLMDVVLENGANDLEVEDGIAEVWADPEFFEDLLKVFEEKGIPTDTAEVVRKPEMVTEITDASVARQVMRMIDRLEELDDVQNVTSNYELSDAVAEELENEE
jgi:transcriptional/translational regulatory protein YebC/TACO1